MMHSLRFLGAVLVLSTLSTAAPQGLTDHLIVQVDDATGFAPAISRYNAAGTLDFTTGTGTSLDFSRVAFTEDGGFVTIQVSPQRLVTYSPSGLAVGSFPIPEVQSGIWDIEVLANGEIAISDGAVHYYSPAGVHRLSDSSWSPSFALHEDREQGLWAAATGGGFSTNYARLDPAGGPLLGGFSAPLMFEMATAPDGTLWLASNFGAGRISHYRTDGTLLSSFVPPEPVFTIVVASDGSLWAGAYGGGRVLHYSAAGQLLGWIPVFVGTGGIIRDLDIGRAEKIGSLACDGQPNSVGAGATVRASGSTAILDNEIIFDVVGLPAGSAGYFLMSNTTAMTPISQGVLCLGSPTLRFSLSVLTASSEGWAQFRPDLMGLPVGTTVTPGSTWYFQHWYRDANPGAVSNLSDAVALTFQ